MRRALTLSSIGLITLLSANCSLPSKEAWAQIRQRGLIPVLIDANSSAVVQNPAVKPSEQDAVRVQPVLTPTVVKTSYASAVPGRPGYVFTPHTAPQKVVDVRGFHSGDEVRCPFTNQPFLVPDFKAVAAASKPAPKTPARRQRVTEVVSNTPTTPALLDTSLARLEPKPEPAPEASTPPPAPQPPVNPPTTAAASEKPGIPYGSRVPGRPGFVYSPFAAKTQLVDVAGTAPGVVVKCPYSNKMFRVPEPVSEQIKPQSVAASPPAPAAPAAPEKPAPAPEAPPSSLLEPGKFGVPSPGQ